MTIDYFLFYVNDMALSRLSPDEFVGYLKYKEAAIAELKTMRTRLEILENLREQVSRQAKEDRDGRAKINTFEASRLAFVAAALEEEPKTLTCQHGNVRVFQGD